MKIEWQAPEYEDKKRSIDWFWALGIIVVAGSITSIIFGDYFFAILLILGGLMLGFFATQKPGMVTYEMTEKGIKINTEFYPFKNMKSFWIQMEPKFILFIKIDRFFMPIISMPIEMDKAEEINKLMIENNIPEEEMKPHMSENIMDNLGF